MISILATVTMLLGMTQEVENPQFKYWSSCKPGSMTKMTMAMEAGGQKVGGEMIYKLVELKDDVAVLEITGTSKVGDKEYPIPPQKQEVKAKEAADKFKIEKEGDEEITVAGKQLQCHWYEFTGKGSDKKSKVWMAKEIPGGMAKAEMGMSGDKTMVMSAVEWEKK